MTTTTTKTVVVVANTINKKVKISLARRVQLTLRADHIQKDTSVLLLFVNMHADSIQNIPKCFLFVSYDPL